MTTDDSKQDGRIIRMPPPPRVRFFLVSLAGTGEDGDTPLVLIKDVDKAGALDQVRAAMPWTVDQPLAVDDVWEDAVPTEVVTLVVALMQAEYFMVMMPMAVAQYQQMFSRVVPVTGMPGMKQ